MRNKRRTLTPEQRAEVAAYERKKHRGYAQWFDEFRSKYSCARCGESRVKALVFHHLDPRTKAQDVAVLALSGKTSQATDEAKKCVCLCANCHHKLHREIGGTGGKPKADGTPEQIKQRAAQKRSRDKKRKQYDAMMRQHWCSVCGKNDHEVLEWHHVNPAEKSFGIGSSTCRREEVVRLEMARCVVMCRNCHKIFHAEDRQYGAD